MKTTTLLAWSLLSAASLAPLASAQQKGAEALVKPKPGDKTTESPPPVFFAPPSGQPATNARPLYSYEQKPMAGRPILIRPEQAQAIIDKFKAAYPKLGSPRLLLYVNRELVDEKSGLKIIARTEKTDVNRATTTSEFQADPGARPSGSNTINISAGGNVTIGGGVGTGADAAPGKRTSATETTKTAVENRYRLDERKELSLADRQTVRDVERLFGRPLRMGGATLADQRIATQLISSDGFKGLTTEGEQARKDREALAKIADVAVEILISSRSVTVAEVSGDRTYTLPDIQATALRLKDAQIMGQASSSDITGKDASAGYFARNFDVREITEAVALALMEDMLTGVSP